MPSVIPMYKGQLTMSKVLGTAASGIRGLSVLRFKRLSLDDGFRTSGSWQLRDVSLAAGRKTGKPGRSRRSHS